VRQLVWLLFFLSGASALVYQVVWSRMLTHVFGSTAIAVGTVIAAFMTGLAIGSWLLGKAADRYRNPLRLYAYLEISAGLAALGAHVLLARITPVYIAAYEAFGRSDLALGLTRFILAFFAVMAPTVLIGGTLPVLVRFVVRHLSAVGTGLSTLYAINTMGAVGGTLLAGFYLIGAHGIHRAVHAAVLCNVGIGVLAWLLSRRAMAPAVAERRGEGELAEPSSETLGPTLQRVLLIGLAISGLTSFAYEIYWARSLVFLLGNSTYALTTMLAAFLSGIALGAYLVRFILDRVADRVALFGWIQLSIGVCAAAVLPTLFAVADPHAIREFLIESSDNVNRLVFFRFGVAFLVMLLPATLIGTTFPLVGRIVVHDIKRSGSTIGRVYALNTVGNVAGALLPGLVLLHWLGIQHGIVMMASLNVCVGLVILSLRPTRTPAVRWMVPAVIVGAGFLFIRPILDSQFPSRAQSASDHVLFYTEGPLATTKVFINPDTREKTMSADGVSIGGTGAVDYKQQLLAHLPKLLIDDVSDELSVGLGSAILAGESARHQRVQRITCVEIEPSVVAGATFFEEESHDVMHDSRLRLVVDDVLNHLRTTPDMYDVISADEKTLMDYASNGFSYSKEYYSLLRDHLAPEGIVVQWVPTGLPPRLYKMVLKTFTNAFPHALLWYSPPAVQYGPTNTILIGSMRRIDLDVERARDRLESETEAFLGIARYGLTTAEAVMAHFVADEGTLRGAVVHSEENTLDHPRYEFFSLQEYAVGAEQRLLANHDFLTNMRRSTAPRFLATMTSDAVDDARLEAAFAAEEQYLTGYRMSLVGAPEAEVFRRLESALSLAPWNESIRSRVFVHYRTAASGHYQQGNVHMAANLMQRALSVFDRSAHAYTEYAIVLFRLGTPRRAIGELQTAIELDPVFVLARRVLADVYVSLGDREEAVAQLRASLDIEPNHDAARKTLARLSSVSVARPTKSTVSP
jgi:spermidine synthase